MVGSISSVTSGFCAGTFIATEDGAAPVELITKDMRVHTRDNGLQSVAWTGIREISFSDMFSTRGLRPVLIRADALGPGAPDHDIEVSPNHRVLVKASRAISPFAEPVARARGRFMENEVLIAARHLVDGEGVVWAEPADLQYFQLMFATDQVILADGLWSESFRPDAAVLEAMEPQMRAMVGAANAKPANAKVVSRPVRRLAGS